MRRIAILVAVLTVLLLAGLGLLVSRALQSVASEQAMRHSVLADRVFDELEEELTALIDREEARPFLQYRFFYVPEGQLLNSAPALSRSPLSEVPEDDWLLGWFQIDPDGDVSTPLEPRNVELASTIDGWSADPAQSERAEKVQAVARTLPFTRATTAAAADPVEATTVLASRGAEGEQRAPEVLGTKAALDLPPAKTAAPVYQAPSKETSTGGDGYVGVDTEVADKKSDGGGSKRKKDQLAAASSTYDTSISSLNKGAESRAGRQQRVTKSRADNLGSFQNPEEYNNAYLQQGDSLPQVGFENEPEDAVADTLDERYRAKDDADGEDAGLLDRIFRRGASERAWEVAATADASVQDEEVEEDPDQGLDEDQAEEQAEEQPQAQAGETDEDYWSPEQRPRFGARNGRTRHTPGRKTSPASAAPTAAAPQRDSAFAEEAVDEEAVNEEGGLRRELTLEVPAPASGPLQGQSKNNDADGRAEVAAVDQKKVEAKEPEEKRLEAAKPQASPPPRQRAPQTRRAQPTRVPEVPMPQGADEVDVEISPLRGHRADEDTLLLYRTVRIGETEYVQGLALLLPALAQWLEEQVLSGSEVRPFLDLAWNVGEVRPQAESDFVFAHTFADPFVSLGATAYLRLLPESGRSGRAWILQLTLMLLVVAALGIAALWRMVSVVVHFAERRSNFVAAVSHELKTPLTAIRMYSEMLRDGFVLNEGKRAEYYETMAAESERLSRLIQNVLELSNLEHNRASTGAEPSVGAVRPVLEEAIRVLERHARDKGFTIELDAPDDLPTVRFERDGLLQVLINLVDNAIKFSQGTDTKVVVVQARAAGHGIALSVRDHGPGVPQRQLKRIFQPFFRGERELTRKTKGTGIGLALVKGIVERMGGQVTARNHPAGGFEVLVALTSA